MVIQMNTLQVSAVAALMYSLREIRGIVAAYLLVPVSEVLTVSNYTINSASVVIQLTTVGTPETPAENLPDFPLIEVKRTGRFALPTIRSYKEENVPNTLLAYPHGKTAFDAALWADSHVRKQGGAWLRRSPQAATAVITANLAVAPAPVAPAPAPVPELAPAGTSAETGQDMTKLMAEIQGIGRKGFETGKRK